LLRESCAWFVVSDLCLLDGAEKLSSSIEQAKNVLCLNKPLRTTEVLARLAILAIKILPHLSMICTIALFTLIINYIEKV